MNNPDETPIDVVEMRQWLADQKASTNPKTGKLWSWSELAKGSGIPSGTLSLFVTSKYEGRNDNVAKNIFKYRQLLASQAERGEGIPAEPGFISTPTATRIRALMIMAHRGRITMGCTGPGTGKTMEMREYQASISNVWVATMEPVTHKLTPMVRSVLRAVGGSASGSTAWMSEQVKSLVTGRSGLLVIDEANNLDLESLEQLRSWHDATGVGLCLLGNEELWQLIRGGKKHHAFARLNSRISASHLQDLPMEDDIKLYLDAWQILDPAMCRLLTAIGLTPGAGGLREIRQIIESASMFAADDGHALSLGHLREAQSTRATRFIRVAA